jgi:hypothetical protein
MSDVRDENMVHVAPSLGHAYALSGRALEAISLLENSIEQAAAIGLMFAQSQRMGWLAHAQLVAGRPAEAGHTAPQRSASPAGITSAARGVDLWNH